MRQNHLLADGFFYAKKGSIGTFISGRTGKIATALFFEQKPFWDADMHVRGIQCLVLMIW